MSRISEGESACRCVQQFEVSLIQVLLSWCDESESKQFSDAEKLLFLRINANKYEKFSGLYEALKLLDMFHTQKLCSAPPSAVPC